MPHHPHQHRVRPSTPCGAGHERGRRPVLESKGLQNIVPFIKTAKNYNEANWWELFLSLQLGTDYDF